MSKGGDEVAPEQLYIVSSLAVRAPCAKCGMWSNGDKSESTRFGKPIEWPRQMADSQGNENTHAWAYRERFDQHDRRFDQHDQQFGEIKTLLAQHTALFAEILARLPEKPQW